MTDGPEGVPTREQLRLLAAAWTGKRYPAYHCANDLRQLLDTGRLPSNIEAAAPLFAEDDPEALARRERLMGTVEQQVLERDHDGRVLLVSPIEGVGLGDRSAGDGEDSSTIR